MKLIELPTESLKTLELLDKLGYNAVLRNEQIVINAEKLFAKDVITIDKFITSINWRTELHYNELNVPIISIIPIISD